MPYKLEWKHFACCRAQLTNKAGTFSVLTCCLCLLLNEPPFSSNACVEQVPCKCFWIDSSPCWMLFINTPLKVVWLWCSYAGLLSHVSPECMWRALTSIRSHKRICNLCLFAQNMASLCLSCEIPFLGKRLPDVIVLYLNLFFIFFFRMQTFFSRYKKRPTFSASVHLLYLYLQMSFWNSNLFPVT